MNRFAHILVALFSGLLAPDIHTGVWVALAQMLPLADIGLKHVFKYEPLHTIFGSIVLGFLYWANLPLIFIFLLASHGLHLLIDILVPEGIEFFAPYSKRKLRFPVPRSELIVSILSGVGSLILLFR